MEDSVAEATRVVLHLIKNSVVFKVLFAAGTFLIFIAILLIFNRCIFRPHNTVETAPQQQQREPDIEDAAGGSSEAVRTNPTVPLLPLAESGGARPRTSRPLNLTTSFSPPKSLASSAAEKLNIKKPERPHSISACETYPSSVLEDVEL